MTFRPHLAVFASLLAACDPGLAGPADFERSLERVFATLADEAGEVQARHGDELYWRAAGHGSTFVPGDWLKTGRASAARVELVGSGRLELESNALVLLEQPEPAAPNEERPQAALDLGSGTVAGMLAKKGKSVQIRGDDGARGRLTATSVEPVEYRVERSQRGTEVAIKRGDALLTIAGHGEPLTAGHVAKVSAAPPQARAPTLLPPPPALLAPADGFALTLRAGLNAALSWAPSRGAAAYRVQLTRDPTFRQPLLELEVTEASTTVALDAEGWHGWRVAGRDAAGRLGEFSAARTLEVRSAIEDLLLEPLEGAEVKVKGKVELTFRWKPQGPDARYRLVVARTAELAAPIAEVETVETRAALSSLEPGGYYWGVFDSTGQPLFPRARKLTLLKATGELKIPGHLQRWGD